MKVVIIGNNVGGTFSAQNIRYLDNSIDIEIYTQEKYPYYTRIKLPDLISGKVAIKDLIVFKEEWYKNNNLKLNLEKKVEKIDPSTKKIFIEGEVSPISYDKLILALGSTPNIPPIKNAINMKDQKKGVFTLRNIDDALEIKNFIKNKQVKNAIVIGGGLLGLELANQIKDIVSETTVVEFFPQLLPKQLDKECGDMLQQEIEDRGINVILNATTDEILGNGDITGIGLKDGRKFAAEIILIQAGIVPTIEIAKAAKIQTNKGIIVNEFLETSEKDIFAVGDCIEYNNQIWGIIPACMEQSKIVAASVVGAKNIEYEGTTPKNTLKIVGIDLTSIGIIDPLKEESGGWDILRKSDKKDCCYEKIVLKDNKLKGAILFGDDRAISYVYNKMEEDVDKHELRKLLEVHIYECSNCGMLYDEAKMDVLFKDLPSDFRCSECGGSKDEFIEKE